MNAILFEEFKLYCKEKILLDLSDEIIQNFSRYFDEICLWNKNINLISFKSESDLIYRHFCDSLYSAKMIRSLNENSKLKIADLGTGSGMPGIPVKIFMPNIELTLVESITKKCKFLENVKEKLNFNIEILNTRAEEIGHKTDYRSKYDFVLSRAVSKFSPNLEIAVPLVKVGGYFIVHKTKNSVDSKDEGLISVENALRHLGAKLEKRIDYNLPEQEYDYCVLAFKKYKETPDMFPRKTGIPEKKPL
ncbi:MAG: 16S rRNA (guanine(527)-N(7))-methyltransferase RsmG [Elusimicrobiota bacterium]|jgi:16S rRNA (guanine527-N7)-methyltransferase|nr:16S rRNA (guanine(527)-N(7))-methyltransferase RsmG [Elusimicrobiota bacterium]